MCSPDVATRSRLARSANGGYSVELPLEMELPETVQVHAGDRLRLDVSGAPEAATPATEAEGVVHRIWHSPKWASAVHLEVQSASPLELSFAPGPVITQPTP